jgi:hypothetical protein
MPVLVIDDEADLASINTKSNRPLDPAVGDDDDEDEKLAPSRTNSLIRSILKRSPRSVYVAYTATPFANIFINPDAIDRRVGDDLFPRDFVFQLPRPKGYTGTEELFGESARDREVLRPIPGEDVAALSALSRRRRGVQIVGRDHTALPASLSEALVAFCLVGAVRSFRPGFEGKAHTMLVHVSSRIPDQERIACAIRDQVEVWREAQHQGQFLGDVFTPGWDTIKNGIAAPGDDLTIVRGAILILQQLTTLELNSNTGENLEYDEKPGRHIVAVGGNRLSRGLTLEGLTVSYFLRTTSMCDTLLQMARWYGFRGGYEDLIRIWTTDGIARWFTELALVEQSLGDSIEDLTRAGFRPDQMVIKLRAHSDLLLTARNKARTAVAEQDTWSGEHPQTILLPLTDYSKLQANRELVDWLIMNLPPLGLRHGGLLARDVSPETICEFLRAYQVHDDIVAFRPDLLTDWIMKRLLVGELTDWSVFIPSPGTGTSITIGNHPVRLVKRSRVSHAARRAEHKRTFVSDRRTHHTEREPAMNNSV